MASNTEAGKQVFRNVLQLAYKHTHSHTRVWVHILFFCSNVFFFLANKTHSKMTEVEEKVMLVPATRYKYEITAGYRGLVCGSQLSSSR